MTTSIRLADGPFARPAPWSVPLFKNVQGNAKILSHCAIQFCLLNNAGGKKVSPTKNIQASSQTPICIVTAEVQETNLAGSDVGPLLKMIKTQGETE